MESAYQYTTTARWTSARAGVMRADAVGLPLTFSAPPEFRGQPGAWTPEHFFVAAVAGCFMSTFVALAELSKVQLLGLEVSATGLVEKPEGFFRFTRLVICPSVTVAQDADAGRAAQLLEKAERVCLVARSLRCEVAVEPAILVEPFTAVAPAPAA